MSPNKPFLPLSCAVRSSPWQQWEKWGTHPCRPRVSFHTHARQTLASSLGPTTLGLLRFVFHVSLHKYILIFLVLLYDWIFNFFCSLNMKLKNTKAWLRCAISYFHSPSGPRVPRPPARLAGLGLGVIWETTTDQESERGCQGRGLAPLPVSIPIHLVLRPGPWIEDQKWLRISQLWAKCKWNHIILVASPLTLPAFSPPGTFV